ncbi:hypothetical protein COW09_00100 [bacterium (Candidatus Moisslbacteria) CG12_big_fil_rev_8_21_14_0_65_36_11]|nr:MAG: hypothetical protein COS23_02075 [bacterium (Candidatus Moisslbacteria) CG02_land_8_20_14_3_00_36_53]PIW68159.1 MAG: hypothetical protein COW09_00100 [bacterium (Candidatus Moisslbacteria) CG12_big_fil_rev_8_21_14_0_65_36_11]PIZ90430.1 MAG: hypothetical protein COX87_00515 [bacterium (Candidatus Moisslbacteria) CG_4_10_14_0_2_um_filter_36_61]
MENNEIINKVVKFTESIVSGGDFNKIEISRILNLSYHSDRNLNIYRGILFVYYFYKFEKLPQKKFKNLSTDKKFLKCVSLLNGNVLPPHEIGSLFLSILTIPDKETECRDVLLGSFYGSLWFLMNNPENFEIAVDYGVEIIKSAFSIDEFDFLEKTKLKKNDAKVINLAGSGKKEVKLLNISSMTAVITAAISKKIGTNIVVEKTISRTTSSITGSGDIFESIGVNLDIPINKMAEMSLETKLGVFDINKIVPKLNRIYDGRLYDVQVFAGLVGGAAIVNPVDADLINYGLVRGSNKLCLAILNKLYPDKNILIISGKDPKGKSIIDQISVVADTEIAQRINGKTFLYTITPREFGFDFEPFRYIQTTKSPGENIEQFIKLLAGQGNKNLEQAVAMEAILNLYGLGIIDNLKKGANLALEIIRSGAGIKILEDLISHSNGNINKFNGLLKVCLN